LGGPVRGDLVLALPAPAAGGLNRACGPAAFPGFLLAGRPREVRAVGVDLRPPQARRPAAVDDARSANARARRELRADGAGDDSVRRVTPAVVDAAELDGSARPGDGARHAAGHAPPDAGELRRLRRRALADERIARRRALLRR